MKTYVFNLPDGYDLNNCFVRFDKWKIIVDKPVDHLMFERVTSEIKELKDWNEIKELKDWKAAYSNI